MWSQCGNVYVRLMDNWFQPFWSLTLLRDRKPEYIFRILSRAKISIYSLCDTHLIKAFRQESVPGKEIFTRGKSRNACFTEKRVSLLSFPTVGHVLSDPLSLVNDQFLSHCSALVASECSTSCYHFQNTYLNWAKNLTALAGKETDC